jgi:hypothetical protein
MDSEEFKRNGKGCDMTALTELQGYHSNDSIPTRRTDVP